MARQRAAASPLRDSEQDDDPVPVRPRSGEPGGRRPSLLRIAAPILVLLVLTLGYLRIYFGVDLTDEAWYVANSYRYVLGDRPYVDEKNVTQQTASVLMYPFTRAWHAAFGTEGIVLYFRHLYLACVVALAAVSWLALRRIFPGKEYVPVAATMPVALLPFAIPSPSYNTLASGAFLAASLGVVSVCLRSSIPLAGAAGFLHGIAVFAYPPLVAPIAVQLALAAATCRDRLRTLLAIAAPVALACLGLLALFLSAGLDVVRRAVSDSSEFIGQAGGWEKIEEFDETILDGFPGLPLAVVCVLLVWLLRRRVPAAAVLLLVLLVLTAKPSGELTTETSVELVRNYSLLAVALYPLVRSVRVARTLLLLVWVPAIVAGLLVSYSSANGALNFGVGSAPGAVVTLVYTVMIVDRVVGRSALRRGAGLVSASVVVGILVALQWTDTYRDEPMGREAVRIGEGPYRGLYAARIKEEFLADVVRLLEPLSGSDSVLFYDEFPAGYLLTAARPNTSLVWSHPVGVFEPAQLAGYRELLFRHFRRVGAPDFIVHVRRGPLHGAWYVEVPYADGDPLATLIERRYVRVGGTDVVLYARAGR